MQRRAQRGLELGADEPHHVVDRVAVVVAWAVMSDLPLMYELVRSFPMSRQGKPNPPATRRGRTASCPVTSTGTGSSARGSSCRLSRSRRAGQASAAATPTAREAEILDVATTRVRRARLRGRPGRRDRRPTRTTKRMIYYYFAARKQLFIAVLERAYGVIRERRAGRRRRPPRSGRPPSAASPSSPSTTTSPTRTSSAW